MYSFGYFPAVRLWFADVEYTLHPALEDGTDSGFRNVGKPQSDAGEIPKRIHKINYLFYSEVFLLIIRVSIKWSQAVNCMPRMLYPGGKSHWVPTEYEAGWAQKPAWTFYKNLSPLS